jgi:hypothetical protein
VFTAVTENLSIAHCWLKINTAVEAISVFLKSGKEKWQNAFRRAGYKEEVLISVLN